MKKTMNFGPRFGPRNETEKVVLAEERFIINIQHSLYAAMNSNEVDNAELGKRLGITEEEVAKVFESECAVDLRFIARAFHVLGYEATLSVSKAMTG